MRGVTDPAVQRLIEYLDGTWVHSHTETDPKSEREAIYRGLMGLAGRMKNTVMDSNGYLLLTISLDFVSVLHLIEISIMRYPKRMIFKTDMKNLQKVMCEVITVLDRCARNPKKEKNFSDLEMACINLERECITLFVLNMEHAGITYMSMVTCASTTLYDDIRRLKNYFNCREE